MKKTFLFDLDGTLVDSISVGIITLNKLSQKYKYNRIDKRKYKELRHSHFKDFIIQHISLTGLRFLLWIFEFYRHFRKNVYSVKLYDGVLDMLEFLKSNNFRLGVVTSNRPSFTNIILENNKIKHYFDFVYPGSSISKKWKYILKVLKKENIRKQDVIYVGDEIRDIISAKKSGIKVISVCWGINSYSILKEFEANWYAFTPYDIIDIAKKL